MPHSFSRQNASPRSISAKKGPSKRSNHFKRSPLRPRRKRRNSAKSAYAPKRLPVPGARESHRVFSRIPTAAENSHILRIDNAVAVKARTALLGSKPGRLGIRVTLRTILIGREGQNLGIRTLKCQMITSAKLQDACLYGSESVDDGRGSKCSNCWAHGPRRLRIHAHDGGECLASIGICGHQGKNTGRLPDLAGESNAE